MSRELFSIEAEHGVLGAIMLKPDLFDEVSAGKGSACCWSITSS